MIQNEPNTAIFKAKEEGKEQNGDKEHFRVYQQANPDSRGDILNVYFTDVIEDPFNYRDLVQGLRTCSDLDIFNFYLACYGGNVQAGTQIINAIRESPAKEINMIVDACCYSMAADLALQGTSLRLNPGTFLMFHNYSGGKGGKGGELLVGIVNDARTNATSTYVWDYPFLSKPEIKGLLRDQDVYVHWNDPDLGDRLKRHFKGRKK